MNINNPAFGNAQISDIDGLSDKLLSLSQKDLDITNTVTSLAEKGTERDKRIDKMAGSHQKDINGLKQSHQSDIDALKTSLAEATQTIFNVSRARNILINPNFQENQREFSGDWSTLKTGQYGFDCWCKTDSGIAQMVEEGRFTPNTTYTLSGEYVTTKQLISPSTGHWRIDVPINASKVVLNEGSFAMPYIEPDISVNRTHCWERYWTVSQIHANPWNRIDSQRWCHIDVPFPVQMRIAPARTYKIHDFKSAPIIGLSSLSRAFVSGNAKDGNGTSVKGVSFDAEIPLK